MPVQYRSLTEAATVSTPAMVPPLLLWTRAAASAIGATLLRLVHSSSGAPRRLVRGGPQDSRLTLVSVPWSSWNQVARVVLGVSPGLLADAWLLLWRGPLRCGPAA